MSVVHEMAIRSIELDSRTADQLTEKAAALGMNLADYLRSLAGPPVAEANKESTLAEFDRMLDELECAPGMPALPDDFGREQIYDGHD